MYKNSGNYSFDVSIEKYVENKTGQAFMITDNSGLNYNKAYFRVANSGSVENGEIWKTTSKYKILANN